MACPRLDGLICMGEEFIQTSKFFPNHLSLVGILWFVLKGI